MQAAVENVGFKWTEFIQPSAVLWSAAKIQQVLFENAFVVTELFQHETPMAERRLYNWTTIFMGALKPDCESVRAV